MANITCVGSRHIRREVDSVIDGVTRVLVSINL